MSYSVNIWGCKPGMDDCCWTGADFSSKGNALAYYHEAIRALENGERFDHYTNDGKTWVEIDGPGLHQEHKITGKVVKQGSDDDDWRREMAMQAGMAFGCDGYNDIMGC